MRLHIDRGFKFSIPMAKQSLSTSSSSCIHALPVVAFTAAKLSPYLNDHNSL